MRILVGLLLAASLTACGGSDAPDGPSFSDVASTCDLGAKDKTAVEFQDVFIDSTSDAVTMRAPRSDDAMAQIGILLVVNCIVDELNGPSTLPDKVGATNALSGTQTDTWDQYEATWNYGRTGLQFIVETK